ncbi:oligosaccharide flippase family protein [Vibrio fluvialis]|uniref:lipopolysaccharide biosynthesis protein n=1 Tax=Vibrio fluvialis TaxID=676 RepID=UPI001180A766|nr:oligosaccharide flippase family protein [Vibrio fluvialis]MBY7995130.1 oligosaccharide flippase family protein [Vibrio fluvialis]MCE7653624.1 oligosaccharide flippase family protein [Vibrio fluvialis]TRN07643.1 hypothetical protein DM586_19945 [Vibrio fluvialis]
MNNKSINNFFSALFGSSSTAVINFITIPFLLHGLGVENYGKLSIILTTLLVVNIVLSFQPWQALIKFWFSHPQEQKELLSLTLFLDVVSCCFCFFISFIVLSSDFFAKNFFDLDTNISLMFSISLLFNPFSFFIGISRLNDKFLFISFCEFLRALIRLIGAFIVVSHGDLFIYSIFYMLSNLLVILLCFFVENSYVRKALVGITKLRKDSWNTIMEFISFSIFVTLKSIVDLPVQHLDKFLVSSFIGNNSVAIYDVAKRINQGFGVFINVFNQVYYPIIVRYISQGFFIKTRNEITKKSLKVFLLTLFISAFSFPFKDYIFILYRNIFSLDHAAFSFSYWYSLIFLLSSCFILLHVLFQSAGFVKKDVIFLLFSNLTYLYICFLGLKHYGLSIILFAYLIQVVMVLIFKLFILYKPQFKF